MKGIGYGAIQRSFWTHPDYKSLPLEAKALAAYLMTGPHSVGIGAYYLPLAYIGADLGIGIDTVKKRLRNLVGSGFCRYCEQGETVWVPKAMRYQPVPNGKVAKGRANEFKAVPKNCSFYSEIAADLLEHGSRWDDEFRNHLDTVSKRYRTPDPDPDPDPDLEGSYEPSCAEPLSRSALEPVSEPALLTIPLIARDGEHPVTQPDVDRWTETYPGIDVLAELRRCREWCHANPAKRKTARGAQKFLVGWLDRAQNRARPAVSGNGQRPPTPRERALAALDALDDGDTPHARTIEH